MQKHGDEHNIPQSSTRKKIGLDFEDCVTIFEGLTWCYNWIWQVLAQNEGFVHFVNKVVTWVYSYHTSHNLKKRYSEILAATKGGTDW